MKEITGRAWLFEDNIDTDIIVPGQYLDAPLQEAAKHALENIRPDFATGVAPGDVVIAGKNFGCGSSRENAAGVLKELGLGAVIADSFGRIFFRNAIAIGLPVLTCRSINQYFADGDMVQVDLDRAVIRNLSNNNRLNGDPLSGEMIAILEKGGILELLKEKGGGAL